MLSIILINQTPDADKSRNALGLNKVLVIAYPCGIVLNAIAERDLSEKNGRVNKT